MTAPMTVDELRHESDRKFSELERGQLAITNQIELLTHSIKALEGTMLMTYQSLERSVVAHAHILDGHNGNSGVKIDLDRIKQARLPERMESLEKVRWLQAGGILTISAILTFLSKLLWP